MSTGLSGFFSAHLADYRRGHTERMAKRYAVPLVLSLNGEMRLLHRRMDIVSALDRAREDICNTTLRGARLALCDPKTRGNRTKVLIRYESSTDVAPVRMTYFLTRSRGHLCIEMIDMCPRHPIGRWYKAFSLLPKEVPSLSSSMSAPH